MSLRFLRHNHVKYRGEDLRFFSDRVHLLPPVRIMESIGILKSVMKEVQGVVAAAVLLVVVILWTAGYFLLVLPTQWLKVEHISWESGNTAGAGSFNAKTKILQISDIHIECNRAVQAALKVIAAERPDYIFLTGDYLDTLKPMPMLRRFMERIRSFRIPTFAVLGNHDYSLDDVTPLVDMMEQLGINVIFNQAISLPEFCLIGIDDFVSERANVEAAFRSASAYPHQRRFIITHDATVVLEINEPFDALVSGHFHGKQFNLPLLFKFAPMGPLPERGIYKGLHRSPYGTYYISKGMGQSGYNYRLFIRSEVTIHEF